MTPRAEQRLRDAGKVGLLLVAALAILRFAGDDTMATEAQDPFGYADRETVAEERDLSGMGIRLSGIKGGYTYAEYDAERDASSSDSFHGFGCLETCEGHSAGWSWARDNEIADPVDCGGISWSFVEGCAAYAVKNGGAAPEERPDLSL